MTEPSTAELDLISQRIAAFRRRLDEACRQASRDTSEVTLIAVTKNHPPSYAAQALRCGLLELGENKPQELAAKRDGVRALDAGLDARATWHFIGRLQRNKAKQVARYADMVHSIDRVPVADAVAGAAETGERWTAAAPLQVLLQVNLDPDAPRDEHDSTAARGGVHPLEVPALAAHVAQRAHLSLRGVMAVAPLGHPVDGCFARLREISERLRADHPGADLISAGMTGDFPAAIAHGATHVRVGTALFGERALA